MRSLLAIFALMGAIGFLSSLLPDQAAASGTYIPPRPPTVNCKANPEAPGCKK